MLQTKSKFRTAWLPVAAALLLPLLTNQLFAQSIKIELMAAKPSWVDKEFVGHAFMCLSLELRSGIKEDCFGFYPKGEGKLGEIRSEFGKNSSRFSRVTISMKKALTEEQRRLVLKTINEWNTKNYSLTNQSCIDFVNTLAQKLDWKTPPRSQLDLPEDFLKKLISANP